MPSFFNCATYSKSWDREVFINLENAEALYILNIDTPDEIIEVLFSSGKVIRIFKKATPSTDWIALKSYIDKSMLKS